MRVLSLLLLLLALAPRVWGAVVFDASGVGNTGANLQTTLSFFVTVGNNTNRALVVGVCTANGSADTATATYNGDAMTQVATAISSGVLAKTYLFRLLNPTIGVAEVVVTFSTARRAGGGGVSLHSVHQVTPLDGTQTAANASDTSTLSVNVATEANDMVVDVGCKRNSANALVMGAQTNRVERYNTATTSTVTGGNVRVGGSTRTGAGSLTMNWSDGAAQSNAMSVIGTNVNDVGTPAPGRSAGFLLLGR